MAKQLRLEQPSSFDIRNTIARKDGVIRDLEKGTGFQDLHAKAQAIEQGADDIIMSGLDRAWYEAELRSIESIQGDKHVFETFLDNGSQALGHVYAGSGLYRVLDSMNRPSRLPNWALIQIDRERMPASNDLWKKNKVSTN